MSITKRPSKTFLVWHPLADGWSSYRTLHDAVAASGSEPVYEAKLKHLGRFKIHTQILPHNEVLPPVRRGQRKMANVPDTGKPTKRKYTKRSPKWKKK